MDNPDPATNKHDQAMQPVNDPDHLEYVIRPSFWCYVLPLCFVLLMVVLTLFGGASVRDLVIALLASVACCVWFDSARVTVKDGLFSYRALPFLVWSVPLAQIKSVKVAWAMSGWSRPHTSPHLVVTRESGAKILVPVGILPEVEARRLADALNESLPWLRSARPVKRPRKRKSRKPPRKGRTT